jgi:hypothetical protein
LKVNIFRNEIKIVWVLLKFYLPQNEPHCLFKHIKTFHLFLFFSIPHFNKCVQISELRRNSRFFFPCKYLLVNERETPVKDPINVWLNVEHRWKIVYESGQFFAVPIRCWWDCWNWLGGEIRTCPILLFPLHDRLFVFLGFLRQFGMAGLFISGPH